MNVLLVQGSSAGGVGRHVAALAAGLVRRGHRVLVAASGQGEADFGFSSAGASHVEVVIGAAPHPVRDARAVRDLARLVPGADVVHAHGLRAGALAVMAAAGRTPVVVTLHNLPVGSRAVRTVSLALEQVVARGAAYVLGVSGDLVDLARRAGARNAERALVPAPAGAAPSASPAELGARLRTDLGLSEHACLAVTVARLAVQKGLPVWLEAVADLTRRRPDLEVVALIAGDGPLRGELQARIDRDDLPVRLLGARSDVPDLFAGADIVVCPSLWEGQPLVIQEALRAGAAIVATDAGGTAEVAGEAAILVPPQNPAALAQAVIDVAGSPRRRHRLRAAAAARAGELPTQDDAVDQVERVYSSVTDIPAVG